jgi:hypothetical protein
MITEYQFNLYTGRWEVKIRTSKEQPRGDYTGRCKSCGSKNLWDDHSMYGCNDCGATYRN